MPRRQTRRVVVPIALARQADAIQPAFVLVTGDLVNDGDNAPQLAALEEALREFHVPVRLLPGNHDDLAAYRARFGAEYYRFTHNNCEFICLDSTALASSLEQWRWMEKSLLDARREGRTHIFLAMHHPPQQLPSRERIERLIRDYGAKVCLCEYTDHGHCGPLTKAGGRPVFLVSEEDLLVLEELEDRYWAEEGRKALAEFKRSGGKTVPWEKVRERLGL